MFAYWNNYAICAGEILKALVQCLHLVCTEDEQGTITNPANRLESSDESEPQVNSFSRQQYRPLEDYTVASVVSQYNSREC